MSDSIEGNGSRSNQQIHEITTALLGSIYRIAIPVFFNSSCLWVCAFKTFKVRNGYGFPDTSHIN